VLKVTIDKTGTPEKIVVEQGNPELAPSAIEAVKQWRWEPYKIKGKPTAVAIVTSITVNYKLHKHKAPVKE